MPSSTWSWAWLPATLFFVSGMLYKEIQFGNTHYAAPLLLWQTYDSFNGLTAYEQANYTMNIFLLTRGWENIV